MGYKDWPFWLKGARNGLIVVLLLSLIQFIIPNTFSPNDPKIWMVLLFIVIWFIPGIIIGIVIATIHKIIKDRKTDSSK